MSDDRCFECLFYMAVRQQVLLPALRRRRHQTGESAPEIIDRFMTGVHARHEAGLPIMPEEVAS